MNVYDFDGTIYNGDSTVDFYLYCLREHPGLAVYAFRQGIGVLRCVAGQIDTTSMKEQFFLSCMGYGIQRRWWTPFGSGDGETSVIGICGNGKRRT